MSMNTQSSSPSPCSESKGPSRFVCWLSLLFRILMSIVILGIGALIGFYWLSNRPTAKRRPPEAQTTLVEVTPLVSADERVVVEAMGTVTPARSIKLASRVSGEVKMVSPELKPGGFFKESERILQIDQRDYELAIQQRMSDLAKAESNLRVEMGQQSVAMREYELLGQDVNEEDQELLLRKPQLAIAEAAVSTARASLEQARLDLQRTIVTAPFNAMIQSREVDLGSQINQGMSLVNLVGTDEYWIEVSIPVDELKWLYIPTGEDIAGSPVRIYHETAWGEGVFREGQVDRLLAELETQGRMARLLVSVADPLDMKKDPDSRHPLLIGSFVRVEIEGKLLSNVMRIPRTAFHDGKHVWIMSPDNALHIREVTPIWSEKEYVYVSEGISSGELLITSSLGASVEGMPLRILGSLIEESFPSTGIGSNVQKEKETER